MAASARKSNMPVVARTRPALVPDAGMVDPRGAPVLSGGGGGVLAALGPTDFEMAQGHGGAARGGALIDQPRQPDVIGGEEDGGGGGPDIGTMLALLGKAAGKSGGPVPSSEPAPSSGGLLDKIKGLFLGDKKPDVAASGGVSAGVTAPDIASRVNIGALEPALPVDAPIPTARPALPGDPPAPPDPRLVQGPAFQPDIGKVSTATPAIPQEEPGFFDKLRGDPLRMFLLTGGLGTMAAASRRGATPLGALGEGALGGLRSGFEQEASTKQRDLDNRKTDIAERRAASDETYHDKMGALADARALAEPEKTGALVTRATAAATNADAATTRAGAAVKNADANTTRAAAYAKGGGSRSGQTEHLIEGLRKENPSLSYADALGLTKRAPTANAETLRKEGLALSAAKSDVAADISGQSTVEKVLPKYRKMYGLGGSPGTGPAMGGGGGANPSGALADAKFAIAHGAPRDKVLARLKAKNIDASGL